MPVLILTVHPSIPGSRRAALQDIARKVGGPAMGRFRAAGAVFRWPEADTLSFHTLLSHILHAPFITNRP